MPHPRYSILISSRNEGASLPATVEDIFRQSSGSDFQVVVVDDASSDQSASFLEDSRGDRPLQLIRNDTRRGLIHSRAQAADLARGDYLVFLDAHCSVSPFWLERLSGHLGRIEGHGIVTPVVYPLNKSAWSMDLVSPPATAYSVSNPVLDFGWVEPLMLDGMLCTPVIGGMAWMCTREWYRHLGELDREMVGWGCENIDISLRTWLAGGWCVVAGDVPVGHLFREISPEPIHGADLTYNKLRCAHTVFSKETFERVVVRFQGLNGFQEALQRIYQAPEPLARLKGHVESIRKRSDAWTIETFRLPLREPGFFHSLPRRPRRRGQQLERPSVAVLVAVSGDQDLGPLLGSLLQRTTYANSEVVLISSGNAAEDISRQVEESIRSQLRLRMLHSSMPLEGGIAENLGAGASEADYLVFLPEDSVILEDHWLEKLLMLAECQPRLLLACPRTKQVKINGGQGDSTEELFDSSWSWEAPFFSGDRRGAPLANQPYQAFSCPDTALFVKRERFLELGGFDPTVRRGPRPVMDLAIRAWLSGSEVFCHPGVSVRCSGRKDVAADRTGYPDSASWIEYAQLLPAVKCFTNPKRLQLCRERSRRGERLLQRNGDYLARCHHRFVSQSRFDDDWLFFKFGIEDLP